MEGSSKADCITATRRGRLAGCVHKLLRWLNYMVLAASMASIICVLAQRLVPTVWGWGFLSSSFLTITSAIVGCISARPEAARTGCYGLHMCLLITSTCMQGAVFLFVLSRPGTALECLQSNRSDYDGRALLKLDAAMLVGAFCIQLMVLAMACVLHFCQPADFYEDLECNIKGGSRRLSRVREETCVEMDEAEATNTDTATKAEAVVKEEENKK